MFTDELDYDPLYLGLDLADWDAIYKEQWEFYESIGEVHAPGNPDPR